jgi:hypothetical protein
MYSSWITTAGTCFGSTWELSGYLYLKKQNLLNNMKDITYNSLSATELIHMQQNFLKHFYAHFALRLLSISLYNVQLIYMYLSQLKELLKRHSVAFYDSEGFLSSEYHS